MQELCLFKKVFQKIFLFPSAPVHRQIFASFSPCQPRSPLLTFHLPVATIFMDKINNSTGNTQTAIRLSGAIYAPGKLWQFFYYPCQVPESDSLVPVPKWAKTPVWVLDRLPMQPKTRKFPPGNLQKNSKHCLCSLTGTISPSFSQAET